jgi:hypothetical protein
VLPELKDRGTGLGSAGVGIGSGGSAGLICRLDERGDVVREPSCQGTVGAGFTEFGEDMLAKGGELVIGR